jgi:hypothetical protein
MYMVRMYRMHKFFSLYNICLTQKAIARKEASDRAENKFNSDLKSSEEINKLG